MRRHIRGEYTPLADVDVRMLPAVPRGGRSVTWAGKTNILPVPEQLLT